MQETKFPTPVFPRTIKLLLLPLLCLTVWLWTTAAPVAAAPQRRAGAQRRAHGRYNRRHARRPVVQAIAQRAERYDEASAGGEVEHESGEEVERREDWFLFQRSYPYSAPPVNGRRLAWAARRQGKGDGDNPLPLASATSLPAWHAIGPAPTTSAFLSNWGETSGRINSIAVSPADPQLILVGASTGGIWRSTDGGANFTSVSDTQVDIAVGSIAISRSNPAIVYAGMGDLYNGYLGTGVLKSTDGGQTWTRVSNSTLPAPGTTVKLEVDPTNPNRVYLLQYQNYDGNPGNILAPSGVFISTDGGINWTRTFAGLVRDLAIKPNDPNTIYIGVRRADAPNVGVPGLYKSIDGGNTWLIVYPSTFGAYTNSTRTDMRIGVTPAAPDTLYLFTGNTISPSAAQLLVVACTDTGIVTCVPRNSTGIDWGQFGYNAYIAVDPANANTLYVGTRDVYKSIDGGQTWASLTRNFVFNSSANTFSYNPFNSLSHPDQHSFAFAPNDPNTIYIGNDGGISKSTNGGATFQALNATLALAQFTGIAMHPTDATRTYGGTQDNGTQVRATSGNGWQEFAEGDGGHPVVNAPDPTIVFSTYIYGAIRWWRFNADGSRTELGRRTSSCNTFNECNTSPRISFYAPFTSNGVDSTLYFGTWKLFVSTSYADPNIPISPTTWSAPSATDLTKGGTDVLTAIGVERKASAQVIYTGSAQGRVMVTANAGQTWTEITAGLPNRFISSITVDPLNSSIAYLTVSGYGSGHVFKTSNQGQTWIDLSGSAPTSLPNVPASDIMPDPLVPTTLYVATDIGVYRSLTGGPVWESFNQGLPPVVVSDITANASGQIQIGTYGRGAYELTANAPDDPTVHFSAANIQVGEAAGRATLTVIRGGASSGVATVDYRTVDTDTFTVGCADTVNNQGGAYGRCDFAAVTGTLQFAAGETQKTLTVPVLDDAYPEGNETFQVQLNNVGGTPLGTPATATITILDNDQPGTPNPIYTTQFFVRQQYLDFLAREPEQSEPWSNILTNCANVNNIDPNSPAAGCDRINVSLSFFGSPEFQLKGFYVFRFYKLAYNRLPEYLEIIPDMSFVAGQTAVEVFARKAQLATLFTGRAEFQTAYGSLSNANYVAALLNRYQLTQVTTPLPANPDGTEKVTLTGADLTTRLDNQTSTRAQVFRAIADSDQVNAAEFNNAFVAMQYYGYLRRKPEAAGYQSWLQVLQSGNQRTMVNGFMNSAEYRLRFGAQ